MGQFIAMNRFKVRRGCEQEFEQAWAQRDTHLQDLPGFVAFSLLRGPEAESHTLYASHTIWASHADFNAWTHSEAFRAAHSGAGARKHLYLEGPNFEGFQVTQAIAAGNGATGVQNRGS